MDEFQPVKECGHLNGSVRAEPEGNRYSIPLKRIFSSLEDYVRVKRSRSGLGLIPGSHFSEVNLIQNPVAWFGTSYQQCELTSIAAGLDDAVVNEPGGVINCGVLNPVLVLHRYLCEAA